MSKSPRRTPAALTVDWPDSPSSDVAGEKARQLAVNLRVAIESSRSIDRASIRSTADKAGLDERTLRNILSGARWPDLRTIALLEEALDTPLWPVRGSKGDLR